MAGKNQRNNQLPSPQGQGNLLLIKQKTYEKIREAANFSSSGEAGKPIKTKIGSRVMGVRTDQAVTSFTAVKIKKATSDPGNNANKDYYKQIHIFEIEDTAASSIYDDVIGITQRAVGQREPVSIVVSGMTTAKVNVTDLAHKYAKTTSTAGELESTDEKTVIRIVDAQNTGSESLCKVLLGAGSGQKGPIFPVQLEQVGGSQGDGTTMPSWTYDVTIVDGQDAGDVILTAVDPTAAPHHWRRHIGQMAPATFGLVWRKDSASGEEQYEYEITWINEILIAAICEEEPAPDPGGGDGGGGGGDGGGLP
jgi:hypothetical protein